LWLALPAEPERIFPARFGFRKSRHNDGRIFNEATLPVFAPDDFEDADELAVDWDLFALDGESAPGYEQHDSARDRAEDRSCAQLAMHEFVHVQSMPKQSWPE
jgi:hypothetical protein